LDFSGGQVINPQAINLKAVNLIVFFVSLPGSLLKPAPMVRHRRAFTAPRLSKPSRFKPSPFKSSGAVMEYLKTQGLNMPRLGLGTFRMQGDVCRAAVESALALGYRHIDTAEMYGNEDAIGPAIAASGIARKDLHVTTKVWNENLAPDAMRRAFDTSLKKLGLDQIDLYLVHWPAPNMNLKSMFETLMKLKEEGRTRAIGVANFNIALLKTVIEEIKAPIACNQIEYHILLDQTPIRKYMASKSLPLVAYCPVAQGRAASNETLIAIGKKHDASGAQVALKWLLDQDGVAAIPKASRRESQQSNLDALNIKLDDDDRKKIAALPKDQRFVKPGFSPVWD
jgi:2,5-diketo-D-gluconate reductase B